MSVVTLIFSSRNSSRSSVCLAAFPSLLISEVSEVDGGGGRDRDKNDEAVRSAPTCYKLEMERGGGPIQ